jgi:hypothetical protein
VSNTSRNGFHLTQEEVFSLFRPKGMCGQLVDNGQSVCILAVGHDLQPWDEKSHGVYEELAALPPSRAAVATSSSFAVIVGTGDEAVLAVATCRSISDDDRVTWDVFSCRPSQPESHEGTVEAATYEEALTTARGVFGEHVNHVQTRAAPVRQASAPTVDNQLRAALLEACEWLRANSAEYPADRTRDGLSMIAAWERLADADNAPSSAVDYRLEWLKWKNWAETIAPPPMQPTGVDYDIQTRRAIDLKLLDRCAIEEWTAERIAAMLDRIKSVYDGDATSGAAEDVSVALGDAIKDIRAGAWRR